MPKLKTDALMTLIGSLTRAEKRHFRLFVRRNQASEELLFLQVFDVLDKKMNYDEAYLLDKIPGLKKGQLANVKAHLMRQLLTSLRMLSLKRSEDIQVRETIDFARVLYDKGLYPHALEQLAKAKDRALAAQSAALVLEILEFEKLIESQYITRSLEGRAEALASQTLEVNERISRTNRFSNLSLQMYSLYLKNGFVRTEADSKEVEAYFRQHLPDIRFEALDFPGKVYWCQSFSWLHHIRQDFLYAFRYTCKWVDLFESDPAMKALFAPLYLKGIHNLLSTLFLLRHYDRFQQVLHSLERFSGSVDLAKNPNVESLYQLYRFIHLINLHYLEGTFSEGVALVTDLRRCIAKNTYRWDDHRVMVFNYRIACLYFGAEDYGRSIEYLNFIIHEKKTDYRSDIQCFARILRLIAHFELGNNVLLDYEIKSVYRFLLHMEELQQVHRHIFTFLRRMTRIHRSELESEFRGLLAKLKPLEKERYESRPFLYLDIISWLEAKIEGVTIQKVIRKNFLKKHKSF